MKKNIIYSILLLINLPLAGCIDRSQQASFVLNSSNIEIIFELKSKHIFLAEYKRYVIIQKNGKEIIRQELFPDTGGYGASNLYRCNENVFFLKGYHDQWVLDFNQNSITAGECIDENPEYVGVFDGGRRTPLTFYTPLERKELKLEASGG